MTIGLTTACICASYGCCAHYRGQPFRVPSKRNFQLLIQFSGDIDIYHVAQPLDAVHSTFLPLNMIAPSRHLHISASWYLGIDDSNQSPFVLVRLESCIRVGFLRIHQSLQHKVLYRQSISVRSPCLAVPCTASSPAMYQAS